MHHLPTYLFYYTCILEEDPCRGVVYLTVLCGHILPCFPTFCCSAIPTSCYIINVFFLSLLISSMISSSLSSWQSLILGGFDLYQEFNECHDSYVVFWLVLCVYWWWGQTVCGPLERVQIFS